MKTKNCAPIFSLGGPEMVWQKKLLWKINCPLREKSSCHVFSAPYTWNCPENVVSNFFLLGFTHGSPEKCLSLVKKKKHSNRIEKCFYSQKVLTVSQGLIQNQPGCRPASFKPSQKKNACSCFHSSLRSLINLQSVQSDSENQPETKKDSRSQTTGQWRVTHWNVNYKIFIFKTTFTLQC